MPRRQRRRCRIHPTLGRTAITGQRWSIGWTVAPDRDLGAHKSGGSALIRGAASGRLWWLSKGVHHHAGVRHRVVARMLAEVTGIRLQGPRLPPEHPEPADATYVIGTFRGRDLAVELTINESDHVLVTEQPLADELKPLLAQSQPIGLRPTRRKSAHRDHPNRGSPPRYRFRRTRNQPHPLRSPPQPDGITGRSLKRR